jgi:hypothetical protein
MDVRTETLSSWQQISDYRRHGWIFRGQSDASRRLKTSLEICFERHKVPAGIRSVVEKELLREFKRAYQQYSPHMPADQSTLEWLSLMRHHGAPTRLLDFSYSIYVAAYFALEDAEDVCAIWGVDPAWAYRETLRLLKEARKDCRLLEIQRLEERDEALFAPTFLDPPFVPSASALNPFRLNERLRLQKGIFLIPGDAALSFEDNLRALPGHEDRDHMVRIEIPRRLQAEAIENLYLMNISRTSLFPGLDGYARALRIYHPIFSPREWKGAGGDVPTA